MPKLNRALTKSITPLVLSCLLLASALPAQAEAPATRDRAKIPDRYKWDLSRIYPDWNAWEADYAAAEALVTEIAGLQGTLAEGPQALERARQVIDRYGMLIDKVDLFASLNQSVDQGNNNFTARSQRAGNLRSNFAQASSWFDPELLSIPWDTMSTWLDKTPGLAPHRFGIENLYRQARHVLDEDKERLLSYFNSFNRAPSQIYDEIAISDIKFPNYVIGSDTITLTEPQTWYQLEANRNQAERAAMFARYIQVYTDYANTYASIYNGVLQRDWAHTQARTYQSTLEASLDSDNVPTSVYENLVMTARTNTAPLRRYHQLRKQALGLERYCWTDRRVKIVEFDKTYDYDAVVPLVIASSARLGAAYQDSVREMLTGRWIDVYENDGKYSGGFESDCFGVHPYILLNFNGTLGEVFTVAHEAGHATHSMYTNSNQPYATSYYTLFVAEVASTFNEALFLDYLLEQTTDPKERIAILQQAIDNLENTFYVQALFADFEWRAHQMVERGEPVTAEALGALINGLIKEYYGDTIEFDSTNNAYWCRISHFFSTPYYVYKYATSYAASFKMVRDALSSDANARQAAAERFLTLIKSGGDDYPIEQLKKAGVDQTRPDTFLAVTEQMARLVAQLEDELAKR